MSFRDNLQHLRATRNMTQEQLAMLLGVSRQSVTKWEAQKAYPEMDKLIKLCQIFDCTLDDLVQGDLTGREPDPQVTPPVPDGPVTDVCGYDEHMRDYARKIPTGVALIILGVAVGVLLEGRGTFIRGSDPDILTVVSIFIGVMAGLAFLIPACMEHSAFAKAHPFIEDFYTEDDKAGARTALGRALPIGIGLIFLGVLFAMGFSESQAHEGIGPCLLLAFIAAGVWVLVHFDMMCDRTDMAKYNKDVAEELEVEDIVNSGLDEARKKVLMREYARNKRIGGICGVIMLTATMVALTWLFLAPSVFGGNFWLPWPIGGIACGIVCVLDDMSDHR